MIIILRDLLRIMEDELMIVISVRSLDPIIDDCIVYHGHADRIDFLRQYLDYRVIEITQSDRSNIDIHLVIQK